ncbi:MAG TPA: hypothetical protein PKK15_23670, partial [Kouleothrix sp.]|nr:hypothetical protein [Kouleothrix sp.]
MTSTELPLLELFAELRRAGMQLGVDEYMLALRALRGGFGLDGRESLRRMCHTLWANTPDEQRLLDYHFDRIIAQDAPPPPMLGEAGAGP